MGKIVGIDLGTTNSLVAYMDAQEGRRARRDVAADVDAERRPRRQVPPRFLQMRVVRPDGTTLWLSGRGAVAARGADGQPLRLISVMADVSETRQAEQLLAVVQERLEA